jgi:DNA repair exonuclease SbcCD ATPase subunit
MPHRCPRTTARLLVLLAGLAPLGGCSDRGGDARAVAEAARTLASVGTADSPSAEGSYASASSTLNSVSVEGDTAKAVAAGLLSQSLQGEGSVAIQRATLAERTLTGSLESVLSLGRRYETITTTAAAHEAFDPSDDLIRISREIAGLEGDAQRAGDERSSLADRIGGLESDAASLRDRSDILRDRSAEMKLASAALSATEAAARAGEIRTLTREADGLDMRISMLEGEAETLRPRLTEIEAEIAKLAEQRSLAIEHADELRALASAKRAEAETARAAARETGEAIRTAINAIDGERTETVIPAGEAATTALERAVRESEKAARSVRSGGTIGKASAQRRLAEMLHLRADGHARYAAVLTKLASMSGLANADAFARAAETESARADELRAGAATAYENAASSLSSLSLRGVEAERADETAQRLNQLASSLRGEEAGQPDDPDDADAPAP